MTRPLWVWLAGVSWDAVPGTEHHLVHQLRDSVDILWVDPASSLIRDPEVRRRRTLSSPAPHVTRLSVLAPPFPYRPVVAEVSRRLANRRLHQALRHLGRRPAAIVGTSPHPDLGVLEETVARVYFATDDFAAGAHLMGNHPGRFTQFERQRVAQAHGLAAVSPQILKRWGHTVKPSIVLPNGCAPEHYADVDSASLPPDVSLPGPIAGVVGQLSNRIDERLLHSVAASGISLLLVGPVLDDFAGGRLLDLPNVQWVGPKPFAALPSYLRVMNVGLVPYSNSDFNRASFPLKVLEYLAAGRDVVSTPLPAIERLDTPLIRTADGPECFAAAVTAAVSASTAKSDSDTKAARRRFAARHSWATRAETLRHFVGEITEAAS